MRAAARAARSPGPLQPEPFNGSEVPAPLFLPQMSAVMAQTLFLSQRRLPEPAAGPSAGGATERSALPCLVFPPGPVSRRGTCLCRLPKRPGVDDYRQGTGRGAARQLQRDKQERHNQHPPPAAAASRRHRRPARPSSRRHQPRGCGGACGPAAAERLRHGREGWSFRSCPSLL